MKAKYGDIVEDILEKVEVQSSVEKIQQTLARKQSTFTAEGKERKKRIIDAVYKKTSNVLDNDGFLVCSPHTPDVC